MPSYLVVFLTHIQRIIEMFLYPSGFVFEETDDTYTAKKELDGRTHNVTSKAYRYRLVYRFFYIPPTEYYVYHINTDCDGHTTSGIYPRLTPRWLTLNDAGHRLAVDVHFKLYRDVLTREG